MEKAFYITTPIYYVNDRPHIGHASTTVWADVQARYQRLRGRRTFFLTGLDEHGIKVQQAAEKRGLPPQQHCDEMAPHFLALWKALNISQDDFVRTTEPRHKAVVQRFLAELHSKGAIYRKKYHGWYSKAAEQFVTEKEKVNGQFPAHLGEVVELEEENYFFRMSDHQEWLIRHIQEHPDWIQPSNRRNEILGALQKPLEDLCISRPKARLAWGIPLPFDPEYVTYVWVDALVNYISVPGYGTERFASFWPADFHLIAKDILTTHTVYWPTMLHAVGIPMPNRILAHGWWLMEREKMSKSLGNIISPQDYIEKYGADALRYFICRELQLANDTDFTEERFLRRFNADLANDLGNLVNRSLSMVHRYRQGNAPGRGAAGAVEEEICKLAAATFDAYHPAMESIAYSTALEAVWKLIARANRYVEETAPWKLAKDPAAASRLDAVLRLLTEISAALAYLVSPFMPDTAAKITNQLAIRDLTESRLRTLDLLSDGHALGPPAPLFPRQSASDCAASRAK
ncbi:MAG: methionine--tRNA ligase [Verrucomicrobia bacterium]|nr:methionine--tRNA ligase [Verrucomicrobiota bacterium]